MRAFGPDLRRILSRALCNRVAAFGAGLGLTALLQSSTATGLMTASFRGRGSGGSGASIGHHVGANVGTTLIVQVLSFNIAAVAPVLFVVGLVAFRAGAQSRIKDWGRVAIGLGLMLLALHILIDSLAPAEDAPAVRRLAPINYRRPDTLHRHRGGADLGSTFKRSDRAADHVARLLEFRHPSGGDGIGPGREPRQRHQSLFRGRSARRPASYRLPAGNLLNRLAGCGPIDAIPANNRRQILGSTARYGENDR